MKKIFVLASVVFALMPAVGAAQSVFDGTWKTDVNTIDFPAKPSIYVFKDGMYECKTCPTKIHIKTDGKDQKIEGNPYADTIAVKIIDKYNLEMISKKDGKMVSRSKIAVSTDGNSMKREYANSSSVNAEVVKGVTSYARTAYDREAPHQMSGSWKAIKADKRSDNGLIVTYKTEGGMLNMSQPTGRIVQCENRRKRRAVQGRSRDDQRLGQGAQEHARRNLQARRQGHRHDENRGRCGRQESQGRLDRQPDQDKR